MTGVNVLQTFLQWNAVMISHHIHITMQVTRVNKWQFTFDWKNIDLISSLGWPFLRNLKRLTKIKFTFDIMYGNMTRMSAAVNRNQAIIRRISLTTKFHHAHILKQPNCPHDSPLRLTHWGRDKMDAISQTIFSNAFSWMKIFVFWLKFHGSLFPRVQLSIFHYWFR